MLCEQGIVKAICINEEAVQVVEVGLMNGKSVKAYFYIEKLLNYPQEELRLKLNDVVLINSSAINLGLGTGGYAFVVTKLGSFSKKSEDYPGHIMKLRYTAQQQPVLACEAPESEHHELFLADDVNLQGQPVFVGELHSMLPLLYVVLKILFPHKTCVYVMDDQACLDIRFSEHVRQLKALYDIKTITFGQAMAGDYECINLYTALETAQKVLQADFIFIFHGPGVAGTATRHGFSGMQLAQWIHTISTCNGQPICIPRVHGLLKRYRHYGISHHTITPLLKHTLTSCHIPYLDISALQSLEMKFIKRYNEQIEQLRSRHHLIKTDFNQAKALCEQALAQYPYNIKSMGNSYDDDPIFFISVASAALLYQQIV